MVPKAVQDAGYTAVGLGVLAFQEVQVRRRTTRAKLESQVNDARQFVGSVAGTVAGQVVKVPAMAVGPICGALSGGRSLIERTLGRSRPEDN